MSGVAMIHDHVTQLGMRYSRTAAAKADDPLDAGIEQALTQDALTHHSRRTEEEHLHDRLD
jgi:hypothetical protein